MNATCLKALFIGLKEESLIRLALQLEELERAESDDGSTISHGDRESIIRDWREREQRARHECDDEFFSAVTSVLRKMKEHRHKTMGARAQFGAAASEDTIRDVYAWIAYRMIKGGQSRDPLLPEQASRHLKQRHPGLTQKRGEQALPDWRAIREATEYELARREAIKVVGRSYYESSFVERLCKDQSLSIEEQAKRYNEAFNQKVQEEQAEFRKRAHKEINWHRIRKDLGLVATPPTTQQD